MKKNALILCSALLAILSVAAVTKLGVPQGGTGATTFTAHGVLLGNGTGAIGATAAPLGGTYLVGNGVSVDPTFQNISSGTTLALPLFRSRKWAYIIEAGNTVSFQGDQSSNTGTATHNVATTGAEAYFQLVTTTSANALATAFGTVTNWENNATTNLAFAVRGANTATTERRFEVYFSDQTDATMLASDNPAGNYAMFLHCNDTAAACAVDTTTYQCVTKDGATQSTANSAVTVDTAYHTFYIQFVGSTRVDFYIDNMNTSVCSISTHLPAAGLMRWGAGIANQTAGTTRTWRMPWNEVSGANW